MQAGCLCVDGSYDMKISALTRTWVQRGVYALFHYLVILRHLTNIMLLQNSGSLFHCSLKAMLSDRSAILQLEGSGVQLELSFYNLVSF